MKVDHIALSVHNVEDSIQHFAQIGFELNRKGKHFETGLPVAFIVNPSSGVMLELIQVYGQPAPGMLHIAYQVEDIQAQCAELLSLGYVYDTEIFLNEGAKTWMAFLRSSAGVVVQVNQPQV